MLDYHFRHCINAHTIEYCLLIIWPVTNFNPRIPEGSVRQSGKQNSWRRWASGSRASSRAENASESNSSPLSRERRSRRERSTFSFPSAAAFATALLSTWVTPEHSCCLQLLDAAPGGSSRGDEAFAEAVWSLLPVGVVVKGIIDCSFTIIVIPVFWFALVLENISGLLFDAFQRNYYEYLGIWIIWTKQLMNQFQMNLCKVFLRKSL